MITIAKGLTSGTVPMGAVMARKHIHDAIFMARRRSTRSSCSTATPIRRTRWPARRPSATLETYQEEGLFERAGELAPYWEEALHALRGRPHVIDIRNIGLMGAIELEPRPGKPGERAYRCHVAGCEQGVMLRITGDTHRAVAAADRHRGADRRDHDARWRGAGRAGVGATQRPDTAQAGMASAAATADHPGRWWILATMALPAFLLNIDFYGITVALPSIGEAFGAGTTALQWTVNGFNLALIAPLVAFGRLGDLVGRRKVLLVGVLLFALGSAMCGSRPWDRRADRWSLRAGSGGGAILDQPSPSSATSSRRAAAASLSRSGPRSGRRARRWARWSAVHSRTCSAGGGSSSSTCPWRRLTILLVLAIVPESRDETARRPVGPAGIRDDHPGPRRVGVRPAGRRRQRLAVAGRPGHDIEQELALLLLAARIVEARCFQPLIEPDLFRHPGYLPVLGVAIAGNFGFSALIFFTALYLQDQLDLAPLQAGLVMIAFSACFVVTLPLAGGLLRRAGPRMLMLIGMALMTAACLLLLPGGLRWLVAGLAVAGIGQGFAFNTSTTAAMDAVPAAKSGEASGVLNAARQLGSTLGIAAAGALFQTIESWGLLAAMEGHAALDSSQASLVRELFSGSSAAKSVVTGLAPALQGEIEAVTSSVFAASFRGAMLLCAAVSLAGVIAAISARPVQPASERVEPRQIEPSS